MLALYIFLGVVLLLGLLLSVRVRLEITAQEEVTLILRILFLKFRLYPKRVTPRSARRDAKKKKKTGHKSKQKTKVPTAGKPKGKKSIGDLLRTLKMVCRIVRRLHKRFHKHLRLTLNRVVVKVGTDDAAKTAIYYGVASSAFSYLVTLIDNLFTVKTKRSSDLRLEPDFLGGAITYDVQIEFSIRLYAVVKLALHALFSYLRERKADSPSPKKSKEVLPEVQESTPNT